MNKLPVLTKDQAPEESQKLFEEIEKAVGMLPNIYAVIGNSSNALSSYLAFSEAQKKGSFSPREREAIFLAVSEENGCNYCLSAHTAIAKMTGFNEEDILKLRAGTYPDKKLNTITNVAKAIISNKGMVDESLISVFYEAGYNNRDLVDLIALIADKTFTNYIGRIARPAIDFPVAQNLHVDVLA